MRPRKSIPGILATGAVAGALVLSGCTAEVVADEPPAAADDAAAPAPEEPAAPAGDRTTVTFWSWVPGIEDAVDLFNDTHDHIYVDFTRITSGEQGQIPHAVTAGIGPDIAQISQHSLPDFIIDQIVVDISAYVADAEPLFTEGAWNAVTFADRIYGIPQDTGPSAMMYRTDIFEQYGVDVPTTWDEYVDAARALRAANPDVYITAFSPNSPWMFLSELWQGGGTVFDIDGDAWTVEIAGAPAMEAANRRQLLLDEGLVRVSEMWTPEFWAEINDGTFATLNIPAWFPLLVAENAPESAGLWRVAPSPTDNGLHGDTGGAVNVVLDGVEDAWAAAEFIVWLNSDPGSQEILISQGGLFPASLAGLESPALASPLDFFGGQDISEVFIASAHSASASNVPGPNYTAMLDRLQDAQVAVANGELTFPEALERVAQEVRDDLAQRGLSVR